MDSKIEIEVVEGLYCDDGTEVQPGDKCDEDDEEEVIFSFEGNSDESWSIRETVTGLLLASFLL